MKVYVYLMTSVVYSQWCRYTNVPRDWLNHFLFLVVHIHVKVSNKPFKR